MSRSVSNNSEPAKSDDRPELVPSLGIALAPLHDRNPADGPPHLYRNGTRRGAHPRQYSTPTFLATVWTLATDIRRKVRLEFVEPGRQQPKRSAHISALCFTTKNDRRCPLWVKGRHRKGSAECPFYPQKRTLIER